MNKMKFINAEGKITTATIDQSKRCLIHYSSHTRANVIRAMAHRGFKPLNH